MAEGREGFGFGGSRRRRGEEGRTVRLDIGLGESQDEGGFSLRQYLRDPETRQEGVLPPGTPPPSPRLDMASALPDFVQDHLVMEQSYLSASPGSFRLENVPQNLAAMQHHGRNDIPFDLMASNPHHHDAMDASDDIPNPPDIQTSGKRLPDFLSDGPIQRENPQQSSPVQIENERLQSENERMRLQLEMLRQQLSQQIQRNESLEVELNRQMSRERSNIGFQNAEKLEEELLRMTKRAIAAENRAAKLKEYFDSSKQFGAASTSAQQTQSERLASQLRNAANTAELSLRQLLQGAENLRHLANSLEPPKVLPSDSDDDDEIRSNRAYR